MRRMSLAVAPAALGGLLLAAGCGTAHHGTAGNGRSGGRGSVPAATASAAQVLAGRAPAEHIPAGMHAVTVSVSYLGSGPSSHTASKTFTSASLIARLAAMLNGAHASAGGAKGCPLPRDAYKLAFATSPAAAPYLVASAGPCAELTVTVLGHPQPSLREPAALGPALTRLMGPPADLPPSARIPPTQ